jgi:hypothetical protein
MVRYHLAALASDRGEQGQPREPVLHIIERRGDAERNTSNVYVIRVPWADAETVRTEVQELRHVPEEAFTGVGATHCTQGGDHGLHPVGTTAAPRWGNRLRRTEPAENVTNNRPPQATRASQQGWTRLNEDEGCAQPVQSRGYRFAQELVQAFYAALSTDGVADRGIAAPRAGDPQQLVETGARRPKPRRTRDCSKTSGRVAPIDLAVERDGWLVRDAAQRDESPSGD